MEFLHGLMTLWLDWFISEYCFIFWLPFYNSTWGEPVTKPLMFSYERHDDSGSWEMKCITVLQISTVTLLFTAWDYITMYTNYIKIYGN